MKKLALAVLIVLASAPAIGAAPTAKELLRYVPAAAEVVVAMDVAALRDHPMVQTWLIEHQTAWSDAHFDAQDFLRDAGLDLRHDVDSMVVAMVPRAGGVRGVAAFGGRFDPIALGVALTKRGSQSVAIGSVTALRLQDPQHANPNAPLVYLTRDVVLAADEETLRATIAAPPQPNVLVGREVAAGRLDVAAPFWMVAAVPQHVRQGTSDLADAPADGAAEAFRSAVTASRAVQRVTVQASLGDDLVLAGWAGTDTEENAGLLRDTIKGAIAAARLHVQDQAPELVEVLRNIKVSVEGSEVRGSAEVPVALIEKLVKERQQRCVANAPLPS